ncbi:hypothetical protein IGI04_019614 [Brassica rapa subsp. trilocularis]|uniref:Uncharacterized protein n=1 Tax=Brassica rapa subsp. trilocularis TaxID=1813537 RepID=A0ABQ7MGC4_BRACM|nr:hypothetical protein IGI04_019614 [Brassica rapa subsp. trilocularis]
MCTSLGQKHPDGRIKTQKHPFKLELASIRRTWTVQSIKTRAHVQINTRTVHGKGQHADMCTDMVHQLSKISTQTVHGKGQHADMCTDMVHQLSKISTRTVHGKGQHADICTDLVHQLSKFSTRTVHGKDQNADMCTDMVHQLSKISTRTVHGKGQHADMCGQHAYICTDGTATDVLCVLNRQPTWAKITRTVHRKGQRADMCTDGQSMDVLCVLTDGHGRPVCADGHTDTHIQQPTWAKITRTVHGKGQRADMCTDGQPDVLCVLMDSHGRPVCADGHTRTLMLAGQMNIRRMSGDWIASVCRLCASAPNYRPTILLSFFTNIVLCLFN